jgi:hypothetical protein
VEASTGQIARSFFRRFDQARIEIETAGGPKFTPGDGSGTKLGPPRMYGGWTVRSGSACRKFPRCAASAQSSSVCSGVDQEIAGYRHRSRAEIDRDSGDSGIKRQAGRYFRAVVFVASFFGVRRGEERRANKSDAGKARAAAGSAPDLRRAG